MTIEATLVEVLRGALTGPPPIYMGMIPQGNDGKPVKLPGVVANRIGSDWPATFCGTGDDLAVVSIQFDFYAESAAMARLHANEARAAFRALPNTPTLQSEISLYESTERSWRVVQTWLAPDYAPST